MNFEFIRITRILAAAAAAIAALGCGSEPLRTDTVLEHGWRFSKGDFEGAAAPEFDDSAWQSVEVPHDWAIYGPFDRDNDSQKVAITQNFETEATTKTGRTGGLPYVGTGWYRTRFDVDGFDASKCVELLFDGAMSEARVWVNGREACFWPFGYNSFHCDVTELLNPDGRGNVLAVRLENLPESSRWYPGAGLYRNVHVITTSRTRIPVWGTFVTTPEVSADEATVALRIEIAGRTDDIAVRTRILDAEGRERASTNSFAPLDDGTVMQTLRVASPALWSPETPALYTAETTISAGGRTVDRYRTRFGIRTVDITPEHGFRLNGTPRKIRGVCNHHDLGPLGAAVNVAALRRQLTMLKDMGCDAIRTSHNMPAPELVELCEQMGFMMMIEPFDEWDIAKCRNGYHRYFAEWAERDMVNMLRRYRNSPAVVMWSIGNEVPNQCADGGWRTAEFLQDICHREDPTRMVTCGMDQVKCIADNGFGARIDIPGFNYRVHLYRYAYERLPQGFVLGSETSSTVSSRGVYKFPVEQASNRTYDDHQCSSYDTECCWWSNLPDADFALSDDMPWVIGQFVWTGFDYLGEPTPYDEMWPNHSSMFGIIDLASLPKDRYWLYRSVWNTSSPTLHVLPHWTWPGREGETTPVCVYTSCPSAELFVNGRSQGLRTKRTDGTQQERYRLTWNDIRYEPGELKVVAYDAEGRAAGEKVVRTAGEPAAIALEADRTELAADGHDLAYVTVRIVDRDGNLCPHDGREVRFEVAGAGSFRAAANGDPTCLDPFHLPSMHAFGGMLTAIVQTSADRCGEITLRAEADGVEACELALRAIGN
ncbi:MAG: DUF4982 domain-containing protein [Alistipes sp.]|nr:DUF4982 domain-containing protein [Alistipes sp.]